MKKKIAILGCENSHANGFLEYINANEEYSSGIEVVGVYSNEPEASRNLSEKFGVPVLNDYRDALGLIDGLIVTARHGDLHYEYAEPYIKSGIPMFIDKPITINEGEAVRFMQALMSAGIKVSGGSSLKHDKAVVALKNDRVNDVDGHTVGGFVRAPLDTSSVYGGFYFYAQHLVEIVLEIFGRYPKSVSATKNGDATNVVFHYDGFDVTGMFIEHNYVYYACRMSEKSVRGADLVCSDDNNWFRKEFDEFYELLMGGEQKISYRDFISPVFVMNAIERSYKNGKEELVNTFEL